MDVQCGKQFIHFFSALFTTEDILVFVVRGHLYCEAAISKLLQNSLKNPDEIDIDRLDYSLKIDLCSALGLFPFDLKPGLKQLGKLRNRIVHNLEYDITEQDQLDFINTLRSTLEEPAEYYFFFSDKTIFPNGLRRCILTLWITLQFKTDNPQESEKNISQISFVLREMSGLDEKAFSEVCKKRREEYYSKK